MKRKTRQEWIEEIPVVEVPDIHAQHLERIRRLKHEIKKRDLVIHNLRESKENLRRAAIKLIDIMDDTAEEDLDHDILRDDDADNDL